MVSLLHRYGRLASLMARKAQLEAKLQHEINHPSHYAGYSYWQVQEIKKQKLRLKEEIWALTHNLTQGGGHHSPAHMLQAAE